MKTIQLITIALIAGAVAAPGQFNFNFAFNSGSTGSDGPLDITTSTNMDLPTNGIFNFTSINVSTGATLRFNRNAANTPVYLLAQSDVTIAGTIDVSGENFPGGRVGGRGGPGGFDGGFPAFNGLGAGDGYGPGGGKAGGHAAGCWGGAFSAGAGSYSTATQSSYTSANKGTPYGSPLLVPLVGGSGGGGSSSGYGGGGGGGAVLIASSTRIDVSGTIAANGGDGLVFFDSCGGNSPFHLNPGSGGAIRLVAPVVAGAGSLIATGPTTGYPPNNYGRIRIDSIDRRYAAFPGYIGTYMVTFPSNRLDIIEVGGTNIVEGSGPVAIQLPTNSDTNRTVTVQARNFNAIVTNLVVLTPENGPRSIYTNIIDNTGNNNPATGTVTVGLPVNAVVTVSAWTQ